MPQINQLSEIFLSQLFWLAVVFGIIYFVIGRGMVPKVRGTVTDREAKIAADLKRAQDAREEADRTEADWRARMNEARAKAAEVEQKGRAASAREMEAKVAKSAGKITKRVEDAEASIRKAVESARAELESIAVDAAQDMVRRLAGIEVDKKQAADAVKANLNG
jgi:F-type H+-transporting ATPase subunit b